MANSKETGGRSRLSNAFLNLALAGAGLVALVLLYGFVARTFVPRTDPVRERNPARLLGDVVQVEVRNGIGQPGAAAVATRYLRRRGFDVVASGNANAFDYTETLVIDRIGNPQAALRVAHALGIPAEDVQTDLRDDLFLDVSVVIGGDYTSLPPFRDPD